MLVPSGESAVAAALGEASAARVAVTIAGAGTGVTGARVPFGGWVLSLEKFTRLEVHPGFAIAGAGVLLRDLHAAAQQSGQFYPPDPTETGASIGGTIATNASGARSFRYGATRRWVMRLRVVLADGRILDVGRGEPIDFEPGNIPLPQTAPSLPAYFGARHSILADHGRAGLEPVPARRALRVLDGYGRGAGSGQSRELGPGPPVGRRGARGGDYARSEAGGDQQALL